MRIGQVMSIRSSSLTAIFPSIAFVASFLMLISGCSEGDPELQVSASELDFGVSQSEEQIYLTNAGDDDGIFESGVKALDYRLEPDADWILVNPDHGRCIKGETERARVAINRSRLSFGENAGKIGVLSNGGDRSIAVTATELNPAICTISPIGMDFGTVCLTLSEDKSFTIRNTGGGTLTGAVSESCSDYSIVSGGGSFDLGPGQSRSVTVRFAPTAVGTSTCMIEAGTSCPGVSCTGVGESCASLPECTVSPTSIDFDTVCLTQSVDESFTITNTGGATLKGTVSESCSDYDVIAGAGSYSLGAGESRTVTVRFDPASIGTKTCVIETGASCSNVNCTGVGKSCPECTVSPTSLNFGTVWVPDMREKNFTITNTGRSTLTGSVTTGCWYFWIASGEGAYSLEAGESRTVRVVFEPNVTVTETCTVQTGSFCSDVICTGHGYEEPVEPHCRISQTTLNFDTVCIGQSKDWAFNIWNFGDAELSGFVSEDCDDYTIISGAGTYRIEECDYRVVTVRFVPTSTGTKLCTIETGTSWCSDVSCTGVGVACTSYSIKPTLWTDIVDNDGDGARSSGRLNFDVDVSSGTDSVYAIVDYKAFGTSSWSPYDITSSFAITGGSSDDAVSLLIGSGNVELPRVDLGYDFRIRIHSVETAEQLTSRDDSVDDQLSGELFEPAVDD